ncbi:histidine kinase [Clostridium carboxidivorans P7]|uniref:histidine kinase n=1 Tax=Clostridium carboxidivorans P7 TaxID=536227 RepID=C6PWP0_9CLOT|nr:PocR ligand-binding domain-containing protein [Clostridium carboxidivorans]AKN29602.1 histidine kinase [Clostridium carboxidivorans P7]EET86328.1 histidine kinase [Clostridium carboxidivorans P7]EFG89473.1 ATPase, histidine kinase-, DNA gyrase B-, and HSP90-like domain protein [Clostridium carboxidivorans P7]
MIENINSDIDVDLIEIKDVIDIELLQTFQDNYAKSMDIASIIVDKKGNPVTSPSFYTSFCNDFIHNTTVGDKRCAESHRKGGEEAARTGRPYIYTCHAGLIDFAAPILIGNKQIGTILGGQILIKKPDEGEYVQTAKEIGVDEAEFVKSVRKIRIISEKKVAAAAEVLFIVANALSQIGYEELKLKRNSKSLENEVIKKSLLLEESNEYNNTKTQLFSTISHELKTPVNIIYSSLQLLESLYKDSSFTYTDDMFLKYSKVMKQNCFRLIKLINNLIDMNKIELGFFTLNLKNKNIVKVIEDVTLSIVEYARLKDIDIIFDTEIEEKITAFDEEKIERIMLNLLSNSIKFTNQGGKIYVNIYDEDENILISVKDTGVGIPEDMFDKIFDTFTQVDASLRRNAEGSGIGLSLVKSLLKMHNGEIAVKSKVGVGSEFMVKLPVKLIESKSNLHEQEAGDLKNIMEKTQIEVSDIYFI